MDVGTSRSTSCSVSRYSNPWRPSGGAYGGRGEALLNGKPCHRIFPPSPASRLFRNRLAIRTTNTGSLLRTAVHQPFFFFLISALFHPSSSISAELLEHSSFISSNFPVFTVDSSLSFSPVYCSAPLSVIAPLEQSN